MNFTRAIFSLGLLAAVVLSACMPQLGPLVTPTPTPGETASPSPAPQAELAGTRWVLESFGESGSGRAVVPAGEITLEFSADGNAGGSSGCNSYGGQYQAAPDGSLSFSELVSTLMACMEQEVMDQEAEYLAMLGRASQYKVDGERLVISSAEGQDVLSFVAAGAGQEPAASELAGSKWVLEHFERVGSEALAPEGEITLQFDEQGDVGGSAGCNSYGGSYRASGQRISFSELFNTEMYCENEALMRQEADYLEMLRSAGQYELRGGELILSGEAFVLTFSRSGEQPGSPQGDDLAGTSWTLESLGGGETTSSLLTGSEITLVFAGEGEAFGNGGCNQYNTPYTLEPKEGSISFGPVVSTRMYCEDVMEQEQGYFAALEAAERFELTGERLVITTAGERTVLTFVEMK